MTPSSSKEPAGSQEPAPDSDTDHMITDSSESCDSDDLDYCSDYSMDSDSSDASGCIGFWLYRPHAEDEDVKQIRRIWEADRLPDPIITPDEYRSVIFDFNLQPVPIFSKK
jgi:hypothetical protein